MPKPKNLGSCIIPGCEYEVVKFNKMTDKTVEKISNKDLENEYNFIKKDDQLYALFLQIKLLNYNRITIVIND